MNPVGRGAAAAVSTSVFVVVLAVIGVVILGCVKGLASLVGFARGRNTTAEDPS